MTIPTVPVATTTGMFAIVVQTDGVLGCYVDQVRITFKWLFSSSGPFVVDFIHNLFIAVQNAVIAGSSFGSSSVISFFIFKVYLFLGGILSMLFLIWKLSNSVFRSNKRAAEDNTDDD